MTRMGKREHFQTKGLLKKYGFAPGDRVSTPKGEAWVIGERDDQLYFHIDGDRGASSWRYQDRTDFAEFAKRNFVLLHRSRGKQYWAPELAQLLDEKYSDETLVCSDSRSIPIVKSVLEVRSPNLIEFLDGLSRTAEGILVPYTYSQMYPVIYYLTVGDLHITTKDCFETLTILRDLKIQTLPLESLEAVIEKENVVELMQKFKTPELEWEKCLNKLCIQFLIQHIGGNQILQEHYRDTFGDTMLQVILHATLQQGPYVATEASDETDDSSSLVLLQ